MATGILQQTWSYENWANDFLLKTLSQYGDKVPASTLRLLSHLFNAQFNWFNRMAGEKKQIGLWDEYDLETCKQMYLETSQGIQDILDKHAADPSVIIEYANSRGMVFQNTLTDILIQLTHHGAYHRGQIAMDLRQHGQEPILTDYIAYLRVKALNPG